MSVVKPSNHPVIPAKEPVKECHRSAESSPPRIPGTARKGRPPAEGPRLAPGKEQGARDCDLWIPACAGKTAWTFGHSCTALPRKVTMTLRGVTIPSGGL
jgi:hypothetical protein